MDEKICQNLPHISRKQPNFFLNNYKKSTIKYNLQQAVVSKLKKVKAKGNQKKISDCNFVLVYQDDWQQRNFLI